MTDTDGRADIEPAQEQQFPAGFVWGTATAAYQVEGAAFEDGRTASIWDTFSHTPGKTANGDTGDVATDHYHRFAGDVALMAELGTTAYRFSTSWSRVIPGGVGPLNPAGIGFYSKLVDTLLEHGISPTLTLYHWDLPEELQAAGGWVNRDTAYRFAEYADAVARALGDRVSIWTTLNEPWCSSFLGYGSGVHAPGRTDGAEALTAVHHLLLGHGLATQALRATLPSPRPISISLNLLVARPASDSEADLIAVRKVDGLQNRIWLDPLFTGRYPQDVREFTAGVTDWSYVRDGDLNIIATPIDVLGVNYYSPALVQHYDGGLASLAIADGHGNGAGDAWPGCSDVEFLKVTGKHTEMGWPIDPSGMYELLIRLANYRIPLAITENGSAWADEVTADGSINDQERIDYLREHLFAVRRAITDGADVRAYYAWSLLDNFEWAYGYAKRFGLVRVDFATQERTIKASGHFYRAIAQSNAVPADGQHSDHGR